ncbi:MAG: SpvB/TcaC N-terminal domain-containing protein, partial [Bacteroidales bacterium]|nr:SpvB/TcaC N-terminal domain-containing protein [Bacteroidales bacterium]
MRKYLIYSSFIVALTLSYIGIFAQQYAVCESGANYVEMQQTCNNISGEYEAREKISLMPNFKFNKNEGGNQVFSIKLNETLVLDLESTPEINVPDIEDIEINTNFAVGSIKGMHGVSSTGAATYTIPIGVPSGVASLEPNISINYNSQSGNGLLGWGWQLAGTSSIVRVPQNIYYDDNITAIQLTNDDRFMLDGVRLLPKDSSSYTDYGTNNFLYEKEITDFSTIKSISNANGPQSFVVTTKDGIIIEYGVTADSRLLTSGNKILAWNINKITDRNNNYIKFTYDNSNQECVISYIEYTGNTNAGQEPTNKITFVYDKRNVDKNLMYINNGQYIKSEKILTKIIVRSNNSVLAKYEFEYFDDDVFTKLYKIRQFGINNEEINSTFVNWGEKKDFLTVGTPISLPVTNKDEKFWLSGNFTGTGFSDILTIDFALTNNMYYHTNLTLFYTNSCDINAKYWPVEYNVGNHYIAVPLPKRSLVYNTSDFTGNLRDDILLAQVVDRIGYNQYGIGAFKIISVVGNSGSYSFVELQQAFPHTDAYRYKLDLAGRNVFLGDYTGDGKTNIMCFLKRDTLIEFQGTMVAFEKNDSDAYLFTPKENELFQFKQESLALFNDLCNTNNEVRCYDFTGDGKQEIMIKYSNQIKIYQVVIDEGKAKFIELLFNNSCNNPQSIITYGDFNGDGKTDILVKETNFMEYKLFIDSNTGNGFNRVELPINYVQYIMESLDNNKDHIFHAFDFNADGKTDIMILRRELITGTEINDLLKYRYNFDIYYSTGNNQFFLKQFGPTEHFTSELFFGDYTGDGAIDIFLQSIQSPPPPSYLNGQPIQHKIFSFNYNNYSCFVENILNGLGNRTQFEYNFINKTTNFNSYLPNLMPDNINSVILPIPVVTKINIDNAFNENSFTVTEYSYTGSLFDKNKRNWIGFYKTTSNQVRVNAADVVTTTENKIIHDGLLVPYKITGGNLGTPETLVSEFHYSIMSNNPNNNNIFFPYVNLTSNITYSSHNELNTQTTENYLDGNGNLYKSITQNNIDHITNKVEYEYSTAGLSIPHKLSKITQTTHYKNQVPYNHTTLFDYCTNTGNLEQETDLISGVTNLFTDYNHYGLPQTMTSNVPEKTPRTKNFVYSQCGRFVLKETDDMDLSVEYIYHPSTNNLVSTTDIYGHITSFKYDNLNRLIETTNPFGI